MRREVPPPTEAGFYARPVQEVARDLVGCVVRHRGAAGRIVEAEGYHESEPASHAYAGLTERNRNLFPHIVEKIRAAELLRTCRPTMFGGFEYDDVRRVRI